MLKERVNGEEDRRRASGRRSLSKDSLYQSFAQNYLHPLTILCYHRISTVMQTHSYYSSAVPTDQFYEQMKYLRRNYEVIPLEEALRLLETRALPKRAVSITFDDGYVELMNGAFQILYDLGLPATVFLIVEHVGTGFPFWWEEVAFHLGISNKEVVSQSLRVINPTISLEGPDWVRRIIDALKEVPTRAREDFLGALRAVTREVCLPRMSLNWEEVQKAQSWGITFGSHSLTHSNLTLLSDEALERELHASRETMYSMTGITCRIMAYPNGDHDDRVRAAAQRAGYRWAVTMERGRNWSTTDPLMLRRQAVYRNYNHYLFAAILHGWLDLPPWFLRAIRVVRTGRIYPTLFLNPL